MRHDPVSSHRKLFPYFCDLIEDNVRSRFIFPIVGLALYILLVLTIIDLSKKIAQPPSQIKSRLPFQDSYSINTFMNSSFPTPRVLITNAEGPLEGQNLTMIMTDLLIADDETKPNCDSSSRNEYPGSLEFIRFHQVCKISITNNTVTSDENGQATFEGLKFERAPQGSYYFSFKDGNSTVLSEEYTSFLQSNVIKLEVLSAPPPVTQKIGEPFKNQPKIRVLDQNGNSVKNKKVVAFSWPESSFSGNLKAYLTEAGKFAWLEGDLSRDSDENGIAVFENLTIKGTNSKYVYIFFVCDGLITQFWGSQDPSYAILLGMNILYKYPIKILSDVAKLQLNSDISTKVEEGEVFKIPPTIKVLNSAGAPLANKLVIVSIYMANNKILPYKYQRKTNGYNNKKLIKPIPGKYHDNYTDPFLAEEVLKPIYTDSEGIVKFNETFFSKKGAVGTFTLVFECEGVTVNSPIITVTAKVQRIKIIVQPSGYVSTQSGDIGKQIIVMLQAIDKNDTAIQGKTPIMEILGTDGKLVGESNIGLYLDTESDLFSPTDENGFINLYFSFSFSKLKIITIILKFTIDEISVQTTPITIENTLQDETQCGSILFSSFPSSAYIGQILTPSPKLTIYSQAGTPLPKAQIILDSNFVVDGETQFPEGIYPNLKSNGAYTSDGAGMISLDKFKFDSGVYSTFHFFAVSYTALDPAYAPKLTEIFTSLQTANADDLVDIQATIEDLINANLITKCVSKTRSILLKPIISRIEISNYVISESTFDQLEIKVGGTSNFKLQFFDFDDKAVINKDITVNYQALQLPSYFDYKSLGLTRGDQTTPEITISNNLLTDAKGEMEVTIKIGQGFPGKYAINFYAFGVYTTAVLFKTDFPFTKIELISDFSSNYDAKVGMPVGTPLNSGDVRVLQGDIPVAGVAVYAQIVGGDKDKAFLDYSEIGSDSNYFSVINTNRLNFTQINGIAKFTGLTLIEVTADNSCVTFAFFVGNSYKFIRTNSTASFCFKSDSSYETYNDLYSKIISMNNPFVVPLKVKVTNNKFTEFQKKGVIVLMAIPYEVSGAPLNYPLEMASLYLKNYVCVYKNLIATPASSKYCSRRLVVQGNKPYFYIVEMTGLKWIQSAFATSFYLSISDVFSYVKPNKTSKSQSDRYILIEGTKMTGKIEVSNTPEIIEIISQPPNIIYVGDVFSVSVQCKVSSGSPILRGIVIAAIVQIPEKNNVENSALDKAKNMLYTFSEGKIDINSLGLFTKNSANIELEAEGSFSKTNRKGIATFNLKVIAGLPGNYALQFESNNIQSKPSSQFTVMNRITSIKIQKDIPKSADIKIGNNEFYILPSQPILNLTYLENLVDLRPKKIEIRIYKSPKDSVINAYKDQLNSSLVKTKSNFDSILSNDLKNTDNMKTDFISTCGSLINAVVNGGKLVKASERVSENFPVNFTTPTQDFKGNLIFTDLAVNFQNVGEFNFIFIVNGIESELSNTITVQEPPLTVEEYIISILQKLLVLSVSIFAMFANSSYLSYWWILMGFASSAVFYGLMNMVDAVPIWKIFMYTIISLICLGLIEISAQVFLKLRSKKGKKTNMTFNVREEMFYEYTYQMLFGKISKNWKDKENYRNPYDILREKIENESFQSKDVKSKEIELVSRKKKDQDEIIEERKEPQEGNSAWISSNASPLQLIKPVITEDNEIFKDRYNKISIFKNLKRIFVPFPYIYHGNSWVINDCFYFPQRFLTSCLLGSVSVAYFTYLFFSSLQGIFASIENMGASVHNSFMIFMGGALSSFKKSFGGTSYNEETFKTGMDFVSFVTEQFQIIGRCLSIGFYVGSSLSLLGFVLLTLVTIYQFKIKALQYRKGVFPMPVDKMSITDATGFIGTQIACSAVSFLIIACVLGIVWTVLIYPLFWKLVWEYKIIIIIILATNISQWLIKKYLLAFLYDPITGVKRRRLFAYYELYSLYADITGGFLTALGRVTNQCIFSFISLLRMDESLLPEWIYKKKNYDGVNNTFISGIYMYHVHNHPIAITAANILMVIWDRQTILKKQGVDTSLYLKKRRLANKFIICYYMMKYPQLIAFRKKTVKNEMEKNESSPGKAPLLSEGKEKKEVKLDNYIK